MSEPRRSTRATTREKTEATQKKPPVPRKTYAKAKSAKPAETSQPAKMAQPVVEKMSEKLAKDQTTQAGSDDEDNADDVEGQGALAYP
jgi:hypothetical protein